MTKIALFPCKSTKKSGKNKSFIQKMIAFHNFSVTLPIIFLKNDY